MSSILKALKKAEQESPKLELPAELPLKVDTKEVVSRRARKVRSSSRVAVTAVGLIVLGIGAWFVFFSEGVPPTGQKDAGLFSPPAGLAPPSPPPRVETAAAEKAKPAAMEAEKGKPPAREVKTERQPPQWKAGRLASSEVKSPEAVREKGAEPAKGKESPVVAPGGGERQEVEPKQPRGATTPPSPPSPEESRESHPDASKFKLEAIVWSENESSRFAVINGQILRAGGVVDGLAVLGVAKEHVSVRSKSRDWKLKFTHD